MPQKKYAQVLDFQPSGLSPVWLIIKLPIKPKKNVKTNLTAFFPSFVFKNGSLILQPQCGQISASSNTSFPHFEQYATRYSSFYIFENIILICKQYVKYINIINFIVYIQYNKSVCFCAVCTNLYFFEY